MGVQGLETYLLTHHRHACPRVKIEDLVSEFRRETGSDTAVAIVDTCILIRQCLNGLDVVCGGEFQAYRRNLLNYVKGLEDIGISPVFFLDGCVDPGKMRCWLDRRGEAHRRMEQIYQSVEEGTNCSPIAVESCVLPAGVYECTILTLKEAGYPVLCAVSECDLEIVRYAREHRCFGIFSRDTDYVILDGARYYLSLFYKHVKISDMSTILFDRDAIASALHLRPEHLPLLASLLQNDYVSHAYLVPLYSKLLGRPREALRPHEKYNLEDLVPSLVGLIRAELWKAPDPVEAILDRTFNGYPPFLLRNLAHDMGLRDQLDMKERLRGQLAVSLAMYEYAPPRGPPARPSPAPSPSPSPSPSHDSDVDLEVLEEARVRHRHIDSLSAGVLSLLAHRVFHMGPALEDPGLPASRTAEGALRPFRRRVYGLLQVPGPFTEWIVPARDPHPQPVQPCVVDPISPDAAEHPHPGLLALWRRDAAGGDVEVDVEVSSQRWRLFAWALAAHRPASARVDALTAALRALPRHAVLPACLLYLLYHSGALSGCGRPAEELVRLLARTCLVARRLSDEVLAALEVRRYERLQVHVAALFMRTATYVVLLNDVLGGPFPLHEVNAASFFNGKLFHQVFTGTLDDAAVVSGDVEEVEDLIFKTVCLEAEEVYVEE